MTGSGASPAEPLSALVRTHGIILGTERYTQCLAFYRDTLGLPVWFEKEGLCCLRFGAGYLMIERGGLARNQRKPNTENPTMLRFNVDDVDRAADLLEARGVKVQRNTFSWGRVGAFIDPDGNACELKDAGDPFFAMSEDGSAANTPNGQVTGTSGVEP